MRRPAPSAGEEPCCLFYIIPGRCNRHFTPLSAGFVAKLIADEKTNNNIMFDMVT
jgi:hypothetical protein